MHPRRSHRWLAAVSPPGRSSASSRAPRASSRVTLLAPLSCVVALASTGCVSIGDDFPVARADELQVGVTTQAQVQEMFGNPLMTGVADANPSWTYVRVRYSPFSGASAQYLEVQFDEQGLLASYSLNRTPGKRPQNGR